MDFTQLKQLFTDEDAVSPVIGVILMVAITVILAAVIGTFVLGLGENVQDSAPQANFQFSYSGNFETTGYASDSTDDIITITHTGGEDVEASTLSVQVGETKITSLSDNAGSDFIADADAEWPDTVATGASLTLTEDTDDDAGQFDAGETVRVIWTSPSGSQSSTIGQSQVPN